VLQHSKYRRAYTIDIIKTLRSLKLQLNSAGNGSFDGTPFDHVTRLSIDHSQEKFLYIDWLLALFPSLKYLDLYAGVITVQNLEMLVGKTYPNLMTLCIHHGFVHPSVYTFFKLAAPNVKFFRVSGNLGSASKKDGYHVDLTGWNLDRCILYFGKAFEKPERINGEITIQGISKTFMINNLEESLIISPSKSDYNRLKISSEFSLTCDDINHIMVNSWRIRRIGDKLYCG
jgi:hypothetical protein